MKKLLFILVVFIGSFVNAQDYDFQQMCSDCVAVNGFYCGDDPTNWTQYAPNGCVINGWINDGWEDCIDASDENGAVPTPIENCTPPAEECDTIYVDVPVIEYIYETLYDTTYIPVTEYIYTYLTDTVIQTEYITQIVIDTVIQVELDTIYNTEYITQIVIDTVEVEVFVPEYIYVTDTIYAEVLDTMFIDVIEYVEVTVFDTITEIEYVEFFVTDTIIQYDTIVNTEYVEIFVVDTIVEIEYQDIIIMEYIDCDTGLPCNSAVIELMEKSKTDGLIYNLSGQAIRNPEGLFIEDGQVKYRIK
tara:strand:+ start:1873 stop:2781 length:909 start_codon:yes stop_codon:yes gene_type:complete